MQAGECGIDGGPRSERPTALAIEVTRDGLLHAGEHPPGVQASPNSKLTWHGEVQADLKAVVTAPGSAVCGSKPRDYTIEYRGKFIDKKGHWRLELKGFDRACVDQRCVFQREYKLTLK